MKAIGHSTSLDDNAKRVEQAITDIRLVVEELLNKNVADVKAINEGEGEFLAQSDPSLTLKCRARQSYKKYTPISP